MLCEKIRLMRFQILPASHELTPRVLVLLQGYAPDKNSLVKRKPLIGPSHEYTVQRQPHTSLAWTFSLVTHI